MVASSPRASSLGSSSCRTVRPARNTADSPGHTGRGGGREGKRRGSKEKVRFEAGGAVRRGGGDRVLPCNMMRSHTASTESQQGSEVNRVRNQGITKWTGDTPTSSWREERRGGGGLLNRL